MAVKKAFGFVRDCVEKYIPSIALAALFIIFCYQVFMRYVLRQPQAWAGAAFCGSFCSVPAMRSA